MLALPVLSKEEVNNVIKNGDKMKMTMTMKAVSGLAVFAVYTMAGRLSIAQTITESPVFAAAEAGNVSAVTSMVAAAPAVLELHDRYGKTPLHYAVAGGHAGLVAVLLKQGASVTVYDNRGWMALHYAAENGSPEIAEMLINSEADVNAFNTMEWTALHLAVQQGRTRVMLCLIGHGANIDAKTSRGATAYNIACDNNQLVIKDFLVSKMRGTSVGLKSSTLVML